MSRAATLLPPATSPVPESTLTTCSSVRSCAARKPSAAAQALGVPRRRHAAGRRRRDHRRQQAAIVAARIACSLVSPLHKTPAPRQVNRREDPPAPPRHPPPLPAAALCFAPTLVPPFLDRIYYEGPPSDHFDGKHFFNPEDRARPQRPLGANVGASAGRRDAGGRPGPDHVPVTPTRPPARVAGQPDAGHLDRPFDRARPDRRPQHPHRSDLVGARLAFLLRRPAPGARAGRALRGSAEDRPRPRQPQPLRPYGPADAASACGSATGRRSSPASATTRS